MDTPPLLYKSVHVTFVFWVPKTPPPPTPYMSGTFVLAPPPPPRVHHCPMGKLCSLFLSQIAIKGVKKVPKLAERAVKIQKYFSCVAL